MRIVAIGDTHGRDTWKKIVDKEMDADKIVFMGDYFDSKDNINAEIQKLNFKEICEIKQLYPEKFILLFGNHDFHYIRGIREQYSGFQEWQMTDIGELVHNAIDKNIVQMCYMNGNFMFTHAGVTKTWCENNGIDLSQDIEEAINLKFYFNPAAFKFKAGKNASQYGDDVTQSPIWVRPSSLLEDQINDYIQIVGHTVQKEIVDYIALSLIDTIEVGEYLSITNGKRKTEKL
jgi:predicted phosphodiesterase